MTSPADGLLPSSFRGTAFYVEKSSDVGNRAFDVKQFPRRDGSRLSDDGLAGRDVTVDAYLPAWADGAAASDAFRAAMLAPGTGPLSLPTAFIPRVGCAKCEQNFESAKLGILRFKLTFVVDDEADASPALGVLAAGISGAAAALSAALPGVLSSAAASPAFATGAAGAMAALSRTVAVALPGAVIAPGLAGIITQARAMAIVGGAGTLTQSERLAK